MTNEPTIEVLTPEGKLRVRAIDVNGETLMVASSEIVPDVPVVRFHSSCVFGESLNAVDCDCGAQLTAARKLILSGAGGFIIYAWEEGRGLGFKSKLQAIALEQIGSIDTAGAFAKLGQPPEPRTFAKHITALQRVFPGHRIKLASRNPVKIKALQEAGYTVERISLDLDMTPERERYVAGKKVILGHLNDD